MRQCLVCWFVLLSILATYRHLLWGFRYANRKEEEDVSFCRFSLISLRIHRWLPLLLLLVCRAMPAPACAVLTLVTSETKVFSIDSLVDYLKIRWMWWYDCLRRLPCQFLLLYGSSGFICLRKLRRVQTCLCSHLVQSLRLWLWSERRMWRSSELRRLRWPVDLCDRPVCQQSMPDASPTPGVTRLICICWLLF